MFCTSINSFIRNMNPFTYGIGIYSQTYFVGLECLVKKHVLCLCKTHIVFKLVPSVNSSWVQILWIPLLPTVFVFRKMEHQAEK